MTGRLIPALRQLRDGLDRKAKAFEKIIQTGDYARIMKKYGLEREMLDKPGINLFAVWSKQNGDKP